MDIIGIIAIIAGAAGAAFVTAVAAFPDLLHRVQGRPTLGEELDSLETGLKRLQRMRTDSASASISDLLTSTLLTSTAHEQTLSKTEFEDLISGAVSRAIDETQPKLLDLEKLISAYHKQALGQATYQFWFSVAAATTGFVWIIYAGTLIDPADTATVFRLVPGTILDAVAALFFRQAGETRTRATDLYDRLRRDRQTQGAIDLITTIEDATIRSFVQAQLALHLAGLAKDLDLAAIRALHDRAPGP
jgi:hypothetical protein